MTSIISRRLSSILDFASLIPTIIPRVAPSISSSSSDTQATEGNIQTLPLPDGRNITYRTYGSPTGTPLFYLHGSPSSSYEAKAFVPCVSPHGPRNIRIIAPNRPGMGQSSPHPRRTLTDHAHDIVAIADSLGIQKFHVIGLSGGGPYCLACAYTIPPERLAGVGVIAGSTPWKFGRKGMDWQCWLRFHCARHLSWMIIPYFRRVIDRKFGEMSLEERREFWRKDVESTAVQLGEKDKEAMKHKEIIEEIVVCSLEAFEQGCDGGIEDSQLIVQDWNFNVEDIKYQGVKLYYGTEDRSAPIHAAREIQKAIKGSTLVEFQGEGHMSILLNQGGAILDDFVKND